LYRLKNYPYNKPVQEEPSVGAKLCKSFKYTLLSLFLFGAIVICGIFIPFNGERILKNVTQGTDTREMLFFFGVYTIKYA
jgi:hypothetical protein